LMQEKLNAVRTPATFELGQNYPNPFARFSANFITTIPLAVPAVAEIKIKIYDLLGREVKTVFSGTLEAGRYAFQWEGKGASGNPVAAGVYLYQLSVNRRAAVTRKMIVIR